MTILLIVGYLLVGAVISFLATPSVVTEQESDAEAGAFAFVLGMLWPFVVCFWLFALLGKAARR